ncbi:MAG: hypothetical protein KME31_22985 [Tolypothrix carrinoi HA7290-LM1]|nr:hypothetical protein [Tolypothrix carrinoi HA7290-LM1]
MLLFFHRPLHKAKDTSLNSLQQEATTGQLLLARWRLTPRRQNQRRIGKRRGIKRLNLRRLIPRRSVKKQSRMRINLLSSTKSKIQNSVFFIQQKAGSEVQILFLRHRLLMKFKK